MVIKSNFFSTLRKETSMNLYFLSLLKVDLERRKNRCSFFPLEPHISLDDVEYLKTRFKIEEGDYVGVVMDEWEDYGFSNGSFQYVPTFYVDDHKFHPLYWNPQEQVCYSTYHLSYSILNRIWRSKMKKEGEEYVFFKVRIGKNRYKIRIKRGNVTWTHKEFLEQIKIIPSYHLSFWSENFDIVCYL